MNVNPRIPLLADGVAINLDSHVHDPEDWYAQFKFDVQDSYGGSCQGWVRSSRCGRRSPEILRTQRLSSRAEADAVFASVEAGKEYRVSLTEASAIVVPESGSVFMAV